MGLTEIQNLSSLSIHARLGLTQNKLSSSIEKLSSGLAINKSSDNPSGMSISEKMRGYISGLKKSSMNAQDGISLLQTADGGVSEITSMVQRMRELAVQGANGVYTSSDRAEIQKEIDQLKQEIDRVAESTEFNTKKLLNGESSGVWNSNTNRLSAIVNGGVDDGNYNVAINVNPGVNQILQSDIMAIRDGAQGVAIKGNSGSNINNAYDPKNLDSSNSGGDIKVNVGTVSDNTAAFTAVVTAGTIAKDTIELADRYLQSGSSIAVDTSNMSASSSASGYFLVEFTKDSDIKSGLEYRVKFVNAETGEEGGWKSFTATTATNSLAGAYTENGIHMTFDMPLATGANTTVSSGDKMLFTVSDNKSQVFSADSTAKGGGTVQIEHDGIKGPYINYDKPNSLTKADNEDGKVDENKVKIFTGRLDREGNFIKGELVLGFEEQPINPITSGAGTLQGSAIIEVRGKGEGATNTTRIKDIANFTDENGIEIFAATQEIEIYGNGKNIKIALEGNDTIADVQRKLSEAIVKSLDMGSINNAINSKLVQFVEQPSKNGLHSVRGSFVIQTALTGKESSLSFVGNQKLISALGLEEIQKPVNNVSQIIVTDTKNGVVMGDIISGDDMAREVVPGLDIKVDSRAGVAAKWNNSTNSLEFERYNDIESMNMQLHVINTRTRLQVGVVKEQNIDISIPQMDTKALGISSLQIASMEDAQKAITDLDYALAKVAKTRGTIGAQINRLESVTINLDNARANMIASESRIRDLDVASESTALATAQVMAQAGMAMLAQANQIPQMTLKLLQ